MIHHSSGVVDNSTQQLMLADRCDLPDFPTIRVARFAVRSKYTLFSNYNIIAKVNIPINFIIYVYMTNIFLNTELKIVLYKD